MASPPQPAVAPQPAAAQPAATPPITEAMAEISPPTVSTSEPKREIGVERVVMAVEAERDDTTADVRGVDVEMEVVREEDELVEDVCGGAEVAPDSARTEMASVDAEMEVDAVRIETYIAEIEAKIREDRAPTVEMEEVVDAGLGVEAREEEDVIEISESEIEELEHRS